MTDLLSTLTRRASAEADPGRPLTVTSAVAGAVSAGSVLLVCMALGLAGWFAADAGRYGDTRDAIRVGADAWLLGHGAHLALPSATVTVVPLGLAVLCGYVTYRLACWVGATSAVDDLRGVLTGATVLSGVYSLVAVVTAVLASHHQAEPGLGRAFVGGFVLSFLAGAAGIARGAGRGGLVRSALPGWASVVATGAFAVLLLMLAAGAVLVTAALLLDIGAAATVLSRLHTDGPGGLMYTLVGIAFVPNAVLLAGAYLLGPGFMVGTGTLVSPTAVVLGPVPAFPLLAALPGDGPTPWWTTGLLAVPVLLAAVAARLAVRRARVDRYDAAAALGLGSGVAGALLFTVVVLLAGGAAGPGRMADVGAFPLQTLLAGTVALGAGGLVGGVLACWRVRRAAAGDPSDGASTEQSRAD